MLVAFLAAQLADGVLTYRGVASMGTAIEGNPILAWYLTAAGVGTTIVAAKGLAVVCGALLHARAMHRTIGALTILYLLGAVLPWLRVLTF